MFKTLVALTILFSTSTVMAAPVLRQFTAKPFLIDGSVNTLEQISNLCGEVITGDTIVEVPALPGSGPVNIGIGGDASELADGANKVITKAFGTDDQIGRNGIALFDVPAGVNAVIIDMNYLNTDGGTEALILGLGIVTTTGLGNDVVKENVETPMVLQQTLKQDLLVCIGDNQQAKIIGVNANARGNEGSRTEMSVKVFQITP